jgi:excisionase family DNA binding protein
LAYRGIKKDTQSAPLADNVAAKVLTVSEACDYLNISRVTIYRMIKRKQFPAFRLTGGLAGDWRINIEDLERWLQSKFISGN